MKEKILELLQKHFENDDTLVCQDIGTITICYLKGSTDSNIIIETIIKPLISQNKIAAYESKEADTIDQIIKDLIQGFVLIDDHNKLLMVHCQKHHVRSIAEPDNERTLNGPKEGFVEARNTNVALIRQKINDPNLKFENIKLGKKIITEISICYISNIVNKEVLKELKKRLSKIKTEGILDSNNIFELICDHKYSFLNTVGRTERPDTMCAKLLEGGVGILVNGTSVCLLVPHLFIENFTSNDDYYTNFYYASFNRILRYLAFFITIIFPGLYIALVAYHHVMLPTFFAVNIAASSSDVPLNVMMECILFIGLFELLREAGLRMPSKIGQALSIVGAIIIGQAAVEAQMVSAPIIIVVAITAVAGFMTTKLKTLVLYLRFLILIAACLFGLYGITFVLLIFLIHLFSLSSFNVQYTAKYMSLNFNKNKDSILRLPFGKIKKNNKSKKGGNDEKNN